MSAPIQPPFREWLEKADEDARVVDILSGVPAPPRSAICFHAQQSAEKTLKALLVYHGRIPPKTHDCTLLLTASLAFAPTLASLRSDCSFVTRYGVAPRYPGLVPDPTEPEMKDAVAAMERIRIAVLALLPN